jgi:hypothetical protein
MMLKITFLKKNCLSFIFIILIINQINSQQQVYWISQSDLVNVGTTCRNTTSSGTSSSAFGFNWTDVLGSNATINSINIEFIIGTECTGATRSTTLNGTTQGSITTSTQCVCNPTTLTTQTPTINVSNYIKGGANQFRITSASAHTGFESNSSLLNGGINYFAKVTVNYSTFSGPAPTITTFSPNIGTCNTLVTIDGTNFDNGTPIVKFNGITASHTYISPTQLTATAPAGATTGAITVQTSGGIATSSSNFSLNTPTITSFSPSSATCNTQVTINGTNFNSTSTVVRFNGVVADHTFVSATQLTAIVPAGNASGIISVQTCGASTATSSSSFTLNTSTPTISSFTTATGTRGTVITISGTNLTCPTAVTFGGTAAFSFNATSSTSITAEVGYGSSGNIAVTTAGGTATLAGFTYTAPAAANSVNIQGTGSTNTITNNQASIVDNGLTVSSNGLVSGFIVTITESYQSGDVLAYNTSTGGALPAGISVASFNTTTRSLVFTGSAIGSDWQRILRNVTLTTTSVVCSPESRKVAFIAGDVFYNPLNGHFYKASASNTSWTTARANAENMSYFGKQGYLTTITSQAENSFISKLLSMNSWIGCSDNYAQINTALGFTLFAASSPTSVTISGTTYTGTNSNGYGEGQWHWVTGPEKGTRMRTGNATNLGGTGSFNTGSVVSGVYQNWQGTEPNDWNASNFGDEDYGHIYTGAGDWNDFPNTSSIGSVIEFGDMPGDNTSNTINTVFTRNIYINGAPSGSITGGNVNVCSGSNSTTLTLSGLASGGTVTRWEYSLDNFLTAGINVTSTSTSLTVTNITETRYYRAIVNASSCPDLATSSTRIGVATTTAGSIISSKSAICTGGSIELTLSGNIGSVVRWERSTSSTFASSVTSISNTTTSLTETLSTAGTYHYRAVVQQSGCGSAVNTNGYPVTVTAGTPPVGGTISSSSSCSGTNTITLTLSGHSGNITKWQFSADGGFVWTDIAHTSATLTQTNVTTNRRYRAIVSTANQACGNESSSSGEVTVFGTTVVRWDGTNSKNSRTISNWCGGIPTRGQDIIISATAANNLMLEENLILGSIDFNGSNRILELGNFDLQVNELKGSGVNNHVKTNGTGRLIINLAPNNPTLFPVGNKAYNPITITNKTGASDVFSVNILDTAYLNGSSSGNIRNPYVKRTWNISKNTPTANVGSGVDFTFNWNANEVVGTLTNPTLNHHDGSSWKIPTVGTTSVSGNSLTYTGYKGSFSPFAIGGSSAVALPVELFSFNTVCESDYVQVNWTTASEINNKSFELYKSDNAIDWSLIHTTDGQGDKATETDYSFKDMDKKFAYYRLKDIDFDGIENWSQIIFADCKSNASKTEIYPNPAQDFIKVIFPFEENTTLYILSMEGKILKSLPLLSKNNLINISDLSEGIYLIELSNKTLIKRVKFVKNNTFR